MVRDFGEKVDARSHEGIALETSSRGLSETVVPDPVAGGRCGLTAGALAAAILLATTSAPAMPIGTPIHYSNR